MHKLEEGCCGHGGARPGCGRKPGVQTRPVRLPVWLLEKLAEQGDLREAIISACVQQYNLQSHKQDKSAE
jgi:hypothetical protein